jgi:hypothetical protein
VNPGGEPERDETGLPPVDIEIPDDARELDRDVQAYRRELRARRRSQRQGRWRRALSRDGVALPLLACCLILALITGTLLTVFSATSNQSLTGLPGSLNSAGTSQGAPAMVMVGNKKLPSATIASEGMATVPLRTLGPAMLVLVPVDCRCTSAFSWLAEVAWIARVPDYVIYTSATRKEVNQLSSAEHGRVRLATEADNQNLLGPDRFPAGIQPGQLTAILLAPDQVATWVSGMGPGDSQERLVQALTS